MTIPEDIRSLCSKVFVGVSVNQEGLVAVPQKATAMGKKKRGACTFRKNDARRAADAAHRCGFKVTGMDFGRDGTIRLMVEDALGARRVVSRRGNEWDEVFKGRDGTH